MIANIKSMYTNDFQLFASTKSEIKVLSVYNYSIVISETTTVYSLI